MRTSGEIPNPQEWLIVSDEEYNALGEFASLEDVYSAFKLLFLCDVYHRIYFYKDGFDKEAIVYRLDN